MNAEIWYNDTREVIVPWNFSPIPLRFIMWTAGLSLFTNISHKGALKKLACHPCIIAVFVGFLLMVLPIELPDFLTSSLNAMSSCTTPVSMLVIGSILALAPIRSLFSLPVLYFTALRLWYSRCWCTPCCCPLIWIACWWISAC